MNNESPSKSGMVSIDQIRGNHNLDINLNINMKNGKDHQSNCSLNREEGLNESENIIENYENGSYYKG